MANELKDLKTPLAAAVSSSSVWRDTELVASHQSGKASGQSQWNETEYCLYRYTPNWSAYCSHHGYLYLCSNELFAVSMIQQHH